MPNMTPIAERPAEVTTRTAPGHWESDFVTGARHRSTIGTLVERTTRLVLLAKMEGMDTQSAYRGCTKKLRHVSAALRQTLIDDRGTEMAAHAWLAKRLAIGVFIAHPHCPWQRSTDENTNELRRQYLPKGTDLSGDIQRELNAIAHRLNSRSHKCLNFATPLEISTQFHHHSPGALGT